MAKYTYGLSPLEQQHKIEKTTLMHMHAHTLTHTHMERDGGLKKGNLANGLMVHKSHDGWQAGMETTTRRKVWKKGVSLFFLAIYSQKDFKN